MKLRFAVLEITKRYRFFTHSSLTLTFATLRSSLPQNGRGKCPPSPLVGEGGGGWGAILTFSCVAKV